MGMTAKHYEIVARSFRMARDVYGMDEGAMEALAYLEGVLSEEFQIENPMFNEETFARKCWAGEGKS